MAITRLISLPPSPLPLGCLVDQLLCRTVATPTNIAPAHYTDLLPIVPAPPSPWLVVVIALVAPRVVVGV